MAERHTNKDLPSFLLDKLTREGIFAILFIGLLGCVGYVAWSAADFVRVQAAEYLISQRATMESLARANADTSAATAKVSDAVEKLVDFADDVSIVHARQQDTLDELCKVAADDQVRDQDIASQLRSLVALMETANTMMGSSVSDREQTRLLLDKIDAGIRNLNDHMESWAISSGASNEGDQ